MANVFLSLGSNLYDRCMNISKAKKHIEKKIGPICKESGLYETAPWEMNSEQYFINQIIIINTSLSPTLLLDLCQQIEKEMGRNKEKDIDYQDRIIDIDILFYDTLIYRDQNLIIPHPRIEQRNFILIPLKEITPFWIHPILGKTIEKLQQECTDKEIVKKYL